MPPRTFTSPGSPSVPLVAGLDHRTTLDDPGDVHDHRQALHLRVVVAFGFRGVVLDLLVDRLVVRHAGLALNLER